MFTLIDEHYIKPGQKERAAKIFEEMSQSVRKAPGFVTRLVLQSQKDATKITTVIVFDSQEAWDKYRQSRKMSFTPDDLKKIFDKEAIDTYNVMTRI